MSRSAPHEPTCLGCAAPAPTVFLDLGRTPLANAFLPAAARGAEETFPLAVGYCRFCHLVQLGELVSPAKMFSDYAYFSSVSESFLEHARLMADAHSERFALGPGSRVLEIASNDGYLLRYFKQRGITVLGVDPARNIATEARRRGIPTLCRFFDLETAAAIVHDYGQADLVLGNNVLAHVPAINGFLTGVRRALKADGAAVFEFPYLRELLDRVEFDTIYHEHVFYFSLSAIAHLVHRAGLELWDVARQSVHGGSLRVFLQHPGTRPITRAVADLLHDEDRYGLTRPESYAAFGARVAGLKAALRALLGDLRRAGKRIAAYGAPAKGNTLLNYCGIGHDLIEFTVDRNRYKQGKLLPGSHIPILPPEELLARRPDYAVILPWNIAPEIITQQRRYVDAGGRFILPVPSPRILAGETGPALAAVS